MTARPVLTVDEPARGPVTALAVVLHGGRSASLEPVRARQLAVLRMLPFARALSAAGGRSGLAVARLRFAVRGWNGAERSPVGDLRWALDQLANRFGPVPVGLVGHSMGGRTALYGADHANVAAIAALAPWIEPGDPVEQLRDRRVLIAHGNRDRMTSARNSAAYAEQARRAGAGVTYVSVADDAHAMLRRAQLWHRLVAGWTTGVLLGDGPAGPAGGSTDATTDVVARALAGAGSLVV